MLPSTGATKAWYFPDMLGDAVKAIIVLSGENAKSKTPPVVTVSLARSMITVGEPEPSAA